MTVRAAPPIPSMARPATESRWPASIVTAACLGYTLFWILGRSGSDAGDGLLAMLRWAPAVVAVPFAVWAALRPQYGFKTQIAFLFVLLVSVILSEPFRDSFYILARIAIAFGLARACVFLSLAQRAMLMQRLLQMMTLLVAVSLLVWLAGIEQAQSIGTSTDRQRLTGIAASPGMLGYVCAVVVPCALYMAAWGSRRTEVRLACAAAALAASLTLVLTDSRSGFASAAVSGVAVLAAPLIASVCRTMQGLRLAQVLACAILLAAYCYPIAVGAGWTQTGTARLTDDSTLMRIVLWEDGWASFTDHPLSGTGLATPIYAYARRGLVEEPVYYHTALLNYLAKAGIFAALAFFAMVAAALWNLLSQFRRLGALPAGVPRRTSDALRNLVCLNLAVLVATLAFSLSEGVLQQMYPGFLLLFLATATLPSARDHAALAAVQR